MRCWIGQQCRILWHKSFDARREAGICRASPILPPDERTAGLPCHQCRSQERASRETMTPVCVRSLASRPTSVAGSAIAVCISCRKGIMINWEKTQRFYREEGHAVRRRRSRRRAVGTKAPLSCSPCRTGAGAWIWARFSYPSPLPYKSVHGQMISGRQFLVFNSSMT